MRNIKRIIFIVSVFLIASSNLTAQISKDVLAGQVNTVTSAVPFLTITPDSRSAAMGDAGVALSPDINSQHWNPAKYSFIENDFGIGASYSPWLRNLIDDIDLAYLSGFKKIGKRSAIGASLKYFSLGNIIFTNINGEPAGEHNPNELAVDVSYSLLLSKNFSGAIAMRYISSNLTGGQYVGETESHPGRAVAADISGYYNKDIQINGSDANLALGFNISNIGNKISYTDESGASFLPINLRLGGALTYVIDEYNKVTITTDLNKLLIPTPGKYVTDEITGEDVLIGNNPADIGVAEGIFKSFSDAPGGGKEELHEITVGGGMEYLYNNIFAIRGGYFHENENKGNRKYFTVGVGIKYTTFALDFSYLIPTAGKTNPLANTVRFSILYNLSAVLEKK